MNNDSHSHCVLPFFDCCLGVTLSHHGCVHDTRKNTYATFSRPSAVDNYGSEFRNYNQEQRSTKNRIANITPTSGSITKVTRTSRRMLTYVGHRGSYDPHTSPMPAQCATGAFYLTTSPTPSREVHA